MNEWIFVFFVWSRHSDRPIIFTLRSKAEGGKFEGSEEKLMEIYELGLRCGVEWIDLEKRREDEEEKKKRKERRKGKRGEETRKEIPKEKKRERMKREKTHHKGEKFKVAQQHQERKEKRKRRRNHPHQSLFLFFLGIFLVFFFNASVFVHLDFFLIFFWFRFLS